jgi:hypothetical protein
MVRDASFWSPRGWAAAAAAAAAAWDH